MAQEWKQKQQEGGCSLILVREENFSVKGQIVNRLGLVVHSSVSEATAQPCSCVVRSGPSPYIQ